MPVRGLLVLFVAGTMLAACSSHSPAGPGEHLPPKVMQKLLLDVSIAEAYSTIVKDSLHKAGSKNIDSLSVYYKDIFNHYHITKEQFTENLDWYKNHPDDLDSIYSKNLAAIVALQAKKSK